jgi:glutathione S-transferase
MIGRYALLEAGVVFESKRMDIHFSKDQLSPWYIAINPAMTVPALTDGKKSWTDSQDILKFAATSAEDRWLDADTTVFPQIEKSVRAHYSISIERLTFGKAMMHIAPLRFIFPRMLAKIIRKLEIDIVNSANYSGSRNSDQKFG